MSAKSQFDNLWGRLRKHPDADVRALVKRIDTLSDEKLSEYFIKHQNDDDVKKAAAEIIKTVREEKGEEHAEDID